VNLALEDLWSSDPRALLKQTYSYSPTERIESCFHTGTSMDFLIGASDATARRIALYFADYGRSGRSVTVQIIDSASTAVLDTRQLTNYQAGVYLVYRYAGAVTIRIVNNTPGPYTPTGSLNALFWGGASDATPAPPTPTPAPPPADTIAPSIAIVNPAPGKQLAEQWYVTVAATDNVGVVGVQVQLDGRNLLQEWTLGQFSQLWDTTYTPNGPHTLTAIARDAAGNRTTSAPIQIVVNNTPPPPIGPSGNSVTFLGTDTVTRGNWKGVYGQDGNVIAQHSVLAPPYSGFDTGGSVNLMLLDLWATDGRALLKQSYSYSPSERIESYFHTASSMDFLLKASDGLPHRVALYFCDYENTGRAATVQALDTARNNALLDSRSLSSYANGVYLVYTYRGSVTLRVTNTNPGSYAPTAAMSAIFWGGSGLPQ
jgi:hypothetical protein